MWAPHPPPPKLYSNLLWHVNRKATNQNDSVRGFSSFFFFPHSQIELLDAICLRQQKQKENLTAISAYPVVYNDL